MAKYHAVTLFSRAKMLELSPAKLLIMLQDFEEDGACKVTIEFKENHKTGVYPAGPVYVIPNFESVRDMRRLYKWVYGAYLNGDAYCRIVFGEIPYDGVPFVPYNNLRSTRN